MTINLIPTQKMPRNLSELTYLVPADLESKIKVGSLVAAPLRGSFTDGVVTTIHKKNIKKPYRLKYITNVKSANIIFTPHQLKLFSELAKYYRVSASLFTHFNLPKLIKSDWGKIYYSPAKQTARKRKPTSKYLWWSNIDERNKFYEQQISLAKKNNSQILIIVPRINNIRLLADQLKLKNTDYTPIHRQLTRQDNVNLWFKLINTRLPITDYRLPNIFIGTRSSLFYPFQNLHTIIIDDEPSPDHKQYDMNPRYDVSVVASYIKTIYQTNILYSSPSPSIEAYARLKPAKRRNLFLFDFAPIKNRSLQKTSKQINQSKLDQPPQNQKLNTNIIHLNLRDEIEKKNYTLLSDTLIDHIKSTLNQNKNIFLFLNRKGESKSVTCRDCGHNFSCPTCGLPLTKTEKNKLICYYCNYEELLPPFCPSCQGPNFSATGLGIQKTVNHLKKLFPDTPIHRLDKDIINNPGLRITDYGLQKIIIGTEYALDKIGWNNIHLLGIINADGLWHHSEFMSNENGYNLLQKILTLPPQNSIIIIQSFSSNSPTIQAIKQNKPAIFYESELNFRREFTYPPFTNLVKISSLDKKETTAKNKAETLHKKINHAFPKIDLSGPSPILRKKIRAYYKFNIILKLNKLSELDKIIKLIPNDFLIDIHPRTLLD